MPPRREPWIKIKVGIVDSDKLASLPSDAARWGWIRTLVKAKTQRTMGVFGSRQHLRSIIAPHSRFIDAYTDVGLLHEWPTDCRCGASYEGDEEAGGSPPDGALVVHDYREEQVQPNAQVFADPEASPGARRTKLWRLRTAVFERDSFTCRYCGNEEYERRWLVADHIVPPEQGGTDDLDNLATACRPCNKKKGGRTPEQARMPLRDVSPVTNGDASRDAPRHVTEPSPGRVTEIGDAAPRHVTSRARGIDVDVDVDVERDSDEKTSKGISQRARDPGAAVIPRQTNGEDQTAKIARLQAKLADAATSDAVREVAIAELGRMGAPLTPDDDLQVGEAPA